MTTAETAGEGMARVTIMGMGMAMDTRMATTTGRRPTWAPPS